MVIMRNLLTQFGEAAAMVDGQEFLVRPTFYALSGLDVDVLNMHIKYVCSAYNIYIELNKITDYEHLSCCANILALCSELPEQWLGEVVLTKSNRLKWKRGKITEPELIIMAHHCIKWGVAGKPSKRITRAKKTSKESLFDPSEYVSILIDEFKMSKDDAWQMTMAEFQELCKSRERKAGGDKPEPPTPEEAADTMKMAREAIARAKQLGIKHETAEQRRGRK